MEQTSRAERKTKRRKTNRILNTAIAVVALLIIIVGFTIFAGGNNEEPAAPEETKTTQEQTAAVTDEDEKKEEEPESVGTKEPVKEEPVKEEEQTEKVIVTEGSESNVEQDIVDPNWEGVGTSQSGTHTSSFEMDSTDWQEKVKALSYATGIASDDMTVWYISGNGPKGAIGTVSPKADQNDAYRVYIEWVEGQGWKPVKVQKLEQNDKGR
ncbi:MULTISPECIES: DUF1510 family protein [Bacillaceae]|uniref:DUF1510 domain-containing protein n=1 Tax=Domibacillus aminovorans TaxID=29332 RepID=A0A177KSG3_9BACI|nr:MULTISPECIES: DUF1510 family protein [Bacillaceae]OAH56087.1 hypothetical protein AWH48_05290 [Domibacillus aminovorans]